MSGIAGAYLRVGLTGAILALCILLLRRLLPRAAGFAWREIIAFLWAFHLLVPLWIPSPVSVYAAVPEPVMQIVERAAPQSNAAAPAQPQSAVSPPQSPQPYPAGSLKGAMDFDPWTVILPVWGAGTAVMLALCAASARKIRRGLSRSEPIADERLLGILREAAKAARLRGLPTLRRAGAGPAAYGVFRPEILLPDAALDAPASTLYLILLHECVHIRRRDVLRLYLLYAIDAVHWWNPVVRLTTAALRCDIELLCDAEVLRLLPEGQRNGYGRAIVETALRPVLLAPAAAGASIKERIRMIKKFKHPRLWIAVAATLAVLALAFGLITVPAREDAALAAPRIAVANEADNLTEPTWRIERKFYPVQTEQPLLPTLGEDMGVMMLWDDAEHLVEWTGGPAFLCRDLVTGIEFNLVRTGGTNHMDAEPATAEDAVLAMQAFGGAWAKEVHAVIVRFDGTWYAAAVDGFPKGKDIIPGNDTEGALCLHFAKSRSHSANEEVAAYQDMVNYAAGSNRDEGDVPVRVIASFLSETGAAIPQNASADTDMPEFGELVPWEEVNALWPEGESTAVVDFVTRREITVTRVVGAPQQGIGETQHADFEAATKEDTAALLACYGGAWSWGRRPVLVYLGGRWIAASISGMPHGAETIGDNGMDGQICMHFAGSKAHGGMTEDEAHQDAVKIAAGE